MKISAISTFVCLSVLASSATAQTTPAPTTAKPATTPAPTTAKPATTPAPTTVKPATTPAPTTVKPATTPAATTKYDPVKGCWSVSVERDATYCITGPICSGSGAQPAGWNCPKKGDVAIERCLSYLASWVPASKSCVAPVDAECKVIKTGAWGCVLKGDSTSVPTTPAPTKPGGNGGNGGGNGGNGGGNGGNGGGNGGNGNNTSGGNSTSNSTLPGKADNGTIQVPTKLVNLAAGAASTGSAATIGAVAAVAAVAMAAIGTVLYKKNQKKSAEVEAEEEVVDVVTP